MLTSRETQWPGTTPQLALSVPPAGRACKHLLSEALLSQPLAAGYIQLSQPLVAAAELCNMTADSSPPVPSPSSSLVLGPLTGLMLALIVGAIVFGIIQAVHPVFLVPERFHAAMGAPPAVWEAN